MGAATDSRVVHTVRAFDFLCIWSSSSICSRKCGADPFKLTFAMKFSFFSLFCRLLGAGVVVLLIPACGGDGAKEGGATEVKVAEEKPAAPVAEPTVVEAPAKPAAEPAQSTPEPEKVAMKKPAGQSADAIFSAPPPMELNGFGSDEPVERPLLPSRGVIKLGPKEFVHTTMEHWEQYDWTTLTVKRWGKFRVRLTYTLSKPSVPLQMRLGEQRLKKALKSAPTPTQVTLGTVYIEKAGDVPFAMFTPSAGAGLALEIREVAFVPTAESDEEIVAAEDGSLTLLAKTATTWSESMRYEPKEEKNCLGFWTEVDDFAEWEFVTAKPGRYKVSVAQGCGPGNGGSKVELQLGDQKIAFTVEETGGFQNWKEVAVGELEIAAAGLQRLVVKPLDKKAKAVLDIQKVVLTPAS